MVQFNFNLTLVCTTPTCFPLIFVLQILSCLCLILHPIDMTHQCTIIIQANLVYVSLVMKIYKQESQDIAQHKPYLKVLHNAYTLLLIDNSMDNSHTKHEPTRQINTYHNKYICVTSYSIRYSHYT